LVIEGTVVDAGIEVELHVDILHQYHLNLSLFKNLCPDQIHFHRHLIPRAPLENATGFLLVRPAPLLEKERDLCPQALVAAVRHPGQNWELEIRKAV